MGLQVLFRALAAAFDGAEQIEREAQRALLMADCSSADPFDATALPDPFLDVAAEGNAHPVCEMVTRTPLPWAPPQTSANPLYVAHSRQKVNVELLGPDGLVKSDAVRLGLYGILPHSEYGIRTHPAEEVFVMLAGQAYWKRDASPYALHGPGERSHHVSMMPHATRTGEKAFLSVYVWHGDIATDGYVYDGIPSK